MPVTIPTKGVCKILALHCSGRRDFSEKHNKEYKKSLKEGWLNEFYGVKIPMKEQYRRLALQCTDRADFKEKYPIDFKQSISYHKEFFGKIKTIFDTTKAEAKKLARYCNGRLDFQHKYPALWRRINNEGWLDELFPRRMSWRMIRVLQQQETKLKKERKIGYKEGWDGCKLRYRIAA